MKRRAVGWCLGLALAGIAAWACGMQSPAPAQKEDIRASSTGSGGKTTMHISSPAFEPGGEIPALYTCDGEDIAPPLKWTEVPKEAKSLALVCEDPDAPVGTWLHWLVVNLPPDCEGLPEGGRLPEGAVQIVNDFGRPSYGGPCPPSGTHRYFFKLFALDVPELNGLTRENFAGELLGHALGTAEVMGRYTRRR